MTVPPHVVVIMPARDEAARIGTALDAVGRAIERLRAAIPGATATVVVAADGCSDATAELARRSGVTVVLTAGGVGVARAAAVAAGLRLHPDACWIASTDADSAVHPAWLLTHLAAERAGADLLLGSIRPDRRELGADLYARWRRHDRPRERHGHVHGANLGIRPRVYRAVGGFPPSCTDEDALLVERCRAAGAMVRSTDRHPVVTSARRVGRAPGGFSAWVRAAALAEGPPS